MELEKHKRFGPINEKELVKTTKWFSNSLWTGKYGVVGMTNFINSYIFWICMTFGVN